MCLEEFEQTEVTLPLLLCDPQVMFIQDKGHVSMSVELLDTEEAQADDPLDVQVRHTDRLCGCGVSAGIHQPKCDLGW